MTGVMWHKIPKTNIEKVIIVASGPSLRGFNFEELKKTNSYIIAVNDAGKYVPFANAWFTIDPWGLSGSCQQLPKPFLGTYYAAVPEDFGLPNARVEAHKHPPSLSVKYLRRLQFHTCGNLPMSEHFSWGFSEDPSCIHTGNSAYGALNMRYHMHAKKVLLLGVDASSGYFYDHKKATRSLSHLPGMFRSAVKQLNERNILVINGSPESKIECFQKYTPKAAIDFFSR